MLALALSLGLMQLQADYAINSKQCSVLFLILVYCIGYRIVSDSGSMSASADSIDLEISILVGADATGRPNMTCTSCSFDVGHLNVHFDGGARC